MDPIGQFLGALLRGGLTSARLNQAELARLRGPGPGALPGQGPQGVPPGERGWWAQRNAQPQRAARRGESRQRAQWNAYVRDLAQRWGIGMQAANIYARAAHQLGIDTRAPGAQQQIMRAIGSGAMARRAAGPYTGGGYAPGPATQPVSPRIAAGAPRVAELPPRASAPASAVPTAAPTAGGPSVHVNVPWMSQGNFPGGFESGCKPTSIAMARAAGARPGQEMRNLSPSQLRGYINSELDAHRPVVIGVDHPGGHHVITVTGRGTDSKGTYYTFNDPGTGHAELGRDTRPENRLRPDASDRLVRGPTGQGGGVINLPYSATYAMRNQ